MRQTALAVQKAILPSFAICFLATVDLLLVFNPTGDRAEPAVMLPARGSARDKRSLEGPDVQQKELLVFHASWSEGEAEGC